MDALVVRRVAARARRGALAEKSRARRRRTRPTEPLAWTPSGEKNNREYVVKLSLAATRANGPTYVACEHPVEIGDGDGGWMTRGADEVRGGVDASEVRVKIMDSVQSAVKPTPVPSAPVAAAPSAPPVERMQNVKYFTAEDVERHNTEDDCWIVVKGKVYDVNAYLRESAHPGGNASITMNAGEDVT